MDTMARVDNSVFVNQIRQCLSNYPVEKAWLFGSYSRGEEREESDVDLLVRYDSDAAVSLFTISRIMVQLSRMLGKRVDLVEEDSILPFAAKSAERDKILIYERGN